MEKCEFFLVTSFDGSVWHDDELVENTPIPRVRELLGGRWERSKQWDTLPFAKAFFNGERRVLVLGFPPGKFTTREQALEAVSQIREGREDVS